LTKADLKRLAGEADLALAEAKGKNRPELGARGGAAAAASDKNRVCSFVWQQLEEQAGPAAPPPAPRFREKRAHERYSVSTPFLVRGDAGFKVAKTVNISLGGARIVTDAPLAAGPALDAILVIEDKAAALKSTVVYSEKGGGEPGFFYTGVKFEGLSFKDIQGLEAYLAPFRKRDTPH
jgi:hypothetical protein